MIGIANAKRGGEREDSGNCRAFFATHVSSGGGGMVFGNGWVLREAAAGELVGRMGFS